MAMRSSSTGLSAGDHQSPPPSGGEGFGSVLSRITVTNQLDGKIARDWKPEGLAIRLSVPRSRLTYQQCGDEIPLSLPGRACRRRTMTRRCLIATVFATAKTAPRAAKKSSGQGKTRLSYVTREGPA